MSEITSDLLAKLAPGTRASLRDRFLPYLNEACPRYGIITELQVAAFLATCMVESDHFKTTREYKARAGTKAGRAQAKYWPSGFYGRALIQLTHKTGYTAFQNDVGDAAGINVLAHPEIIEEPKWAVEASCWFWEKNDLNNYADLGLKGFHALEGVVNTGRPTGNAWGYPERLAAYELARRIMPDDFALNAAADPPEPELVASAEVPTQETPATTIPDLTSTPEDQAQPESAISQPLISQKPTLWERLTGWQEKVDKLSSLKNSLNPFSASLSPISGTSGTTVVTTKLGGWGVLIKGIVSGYWPEMVVGAVLIGIAVAYLALAKRNAARRAASPIAVATAEVKI